MRVLWSIKGCLGEEQFTKIREQPLDALLCANEDIVRWTAALKQYLANMEMQ